MRTGAAAPDRHGWLIPAATAVLAVTAIRVWLLWLNRMDLFVDEAQYWLWGRELAFGYYSKPPMIGWVIRAVTEMAGNDAPFWVRLPAPLFHAATALILGRIAAGLWGRQAAIWVALGFITLPMVAAGSILISTDTIMFPFLALALGFWLRMLARPGPGWALAAGVALGLAFLSKYAAIYYPLCAALAAVLIRPARPRLRDAGLALLAFAVTISPNVVWNLQNGLTTLEHTLDNADWVRDPSGRAGFNIAGLAEFLGSQFAVFGPVLFAALIWGALRWSDRDAPTRLMLVFALPVVAIVSVEALLSGAYANWAAAAYLAGTLAVLPRLGRGLRIASFAINGTVALALPVLGVYAPSASFGGPPVLERYLGRVDLSDRILDIAEAEGQRVIVADNRDLLADLFYTGRDRDVSIHAPPPEGRASNHYALRHALPRGLSGTVLYVAAGTPPACAAGTDPLTELTPETGAYRGKQFVLFKLPASCWNG
ncbi:ArnT family glycosyltransferase [Rhodovulum visakhapatnamense]|uniref:Dolichyl-phosphate-mannose-protein mannosyltransferase n=1 Tax=Rhodovulum visakhapatnamense TaxID=364297 RepID=A0A4V3GS47_9RHOB|nr:glycosyltransferase family 39 protein [Rhodovulum visakhapatnamense]TDX21403.1 dolichyl-phosphate-mannose-protein mannosyltransferase [Rhodovulum visakhapatnamense]